MTPEEAIKLIAHIIEEKKKLEGDIFLRIKEFEEKYDLSLAFIRNVPYITANGDGKTQAIQIDIKI